MPDIAASNVTYTIGVEDSINLNGRNLRQVTLAFGDGALTYPSGGVPLLAGSLGCPNVIESFKFSEAAAGDGLVYKYDKSAATIRIYEGDYAQAGDAPLVELDSGSDTPAATTLECEVMGW